MDDPTAQTGGESEPATMEETMGAVFDKAVEAEAAEAVVTAEPEKTETKETPEGEQPRTEDGRFASKEGSESGADRGDAPAEAKETTDQGTPTEVEPAKVIDPPVSWSAEAKALWGELSPAIQQQVLKRETDTNTALQDRAEKLKGYEPLTAALEPVGEHLRLNGMTNESYVTQLVAADQFLRRSPAEAIQWLARSYGVDLSTANAEPDGEPVNPQYAALEQRVGQLTNYLETQATGAAASQHANASSEIEAFKSDPANLHFEAVKASMGALMDAKEATSLKDAYDQATWKNPEIRAQILADQKAEEMAKRDKEAKERATEAVRVAGTNLSSRGTSGNGATPSNLSMEEEMAQTYDAHQGAA